MLQQHTYSQPTTLLSKTGSGYSSRPPNCAEIQWDFHINVTYRAEYEIAVSTNTS